jgi:hypothetical protein
LIDCLIDGTEMKNRDAKIKGLEVKFKEQEREGERQKLMIDEIQTSLHQEIVRLRETLRKSQAGIFEDDPYESFSVFDFLRCEIKIVFANHHSPAHRSYVHVYIPLPSDVAMSNRSARRIRRAERGFDANDSSIRARKEIIGETVEKDVDCQR